MVAKDEASGRRSQSALHRSGVTRKLGGTQCDQYGLALIYAEMLTGLHPWRGRGAAQAAQTPDLALLTRKDRAIIQRGAEPGPPASFR